MRKPEAARSPRFLGIVVLILLCGCSDVSDPETRIRETLVAMETAAEAGDREAFLEHVSEHFGGQKGGYDRKGLGDLLRVQILKHTRVNATILTQDYELFPGRARGHLTVLLTGGPRSWLPESGQVYEVTTAWVEDDGEWRLLSAEWDRSAAGF